MIKILGPALTLGFMLAIPASPADAQSRFMGKSGCDAQFTRGAGSYGIRLDAKQQAYLAAHTVGDTNVLLIIQRKNGQDQCGIVRDATRSSHPRYFFEFNCSDAKALSAVAIGTRRADDPKISGVADQAWLISLKMLRFIPDKKPVVCTRVSYAGPDEGGDLAVWASQRALKAQKKR
jgi:hypothetical protein